SKTSNPAVASQVLEALAKTRKRAIAHLQGAPKAPGPRGVEIADRLAEAAALAVNRPNQTDAPEVPRAALTDGQRQVRGLFCGGTLCQEAAALIGNGSLNRFTDFGDDQYTRGRAHTMIDPTLRNQAIVEAGADPNVAVILLDVIL